MTEPRAYYNEHDKFAAAWLRELITAGHIAPGDVDERDIRDVVPHELTRYTQCHFFAGIGGWSYALRLAGWPDDKPVWTGSCPCQPFSAAGQRKGHADERHLWPAFFHLIEQCRPAVVFGEQVEAAIRHGWLDLVQDDLEGIDYAFGAVGFPAASVGAPHIRQRLYFVADAMRGGTRHRPYESLGAETEVDEGNGSVSRERLRLGVEGSPSIVADAQHAERRPELEKDAHSSRRNGFGRSGDAGELADAPSLRREQRRAASTTPLQGQRAERSGEHSESEHAGELSRRPEGLRGIGVLVEPPSEQVGISGRTRQPRTADSELGNTHDARPQGRSVSGAVGEGNGSSERAAGAAGVDGFWKNADWIPCIDGKARPVEPGTFPLAHGLPTHYSHLYPELQRLAGVAGLSKSSLKRAKAYRTGSLRGYGNAIVLQQAAAFIQAYLDAATAITTITSATEVQGVS